MNPAGSAWIAGNAPTGTVTFRDGAATLGTAAVSGTTAQLVTSTLAGGAHSLTASYAGDAHNNPSASEAVVLSLTDPLTPPTLGMSGIADGASFVTNSGNTWTSGADSGEVGPAFRRKPGHRSGRCRAVA
ncbi:MAG: Ig-like domain repeat protein [Betaproteobacteria bacterium]|nr:Ig-like domain repeat protein [Betaproteobacteria bacterium]